MGQFFSQEPPAGIIQARIDNAILPNWPGGGASPINSSIAVRIPAGTRIYVGEVGTQNGFFASGKHIVEAELVNNGVPLIGRQMHVFSNQAISGLLDLTNPVVRQNLGISLGDLTRTGGSQVWRYEVTQPLGAWARQNGYQGIIVPSAQADGGVNLILFDAKGVK